MTSLVRNQHQCHRASAVKLLHGFHSCADLKKGTRRPSGASHGRKSSALLDRFLQGECAGARRS